MSFFAKGDFKTREEWLKKQKRDMMKKESLKYHEFNKAAQPHQTPKLKQPVIDEKHTLKNILATQDTEAISQAPESEIIPEGKCKFKSIQDSELYQSMAGRVTAQQAVVTEQRQQIKLLDRQIQQIKSQNAILKGVYDDATDLYKQKSQIQSQNIKLKKLYTQMEQYLNSNGAFWQEGQLFGQINIVKIKKDIKDAKTNYRTPETFEFQLLVKRIEQLNESLLAEHGSKKFVPVGGVHKLCELQNMDVIFYRNGVKFGSLKFIEYSSKEGKRMLGDLTDGYYPFLLQKGYPDGVLMKIQNSLSESYGEEEAGIEKVAPQAQWFSGQGYSLD